MASSGLVAYNATQVDMKIEKGTIRRIAVKPDATKACINAKTTVTRARETVGYIMSILSLILLRPSGSGTSCTQNAPPTKAESRQSAISTIVPSTGPENNPKYKLPV